MKRWTQLFKVFASISRLRIVKFLSSEKECTVSQIAREIHVSFKGTSRHLGILSALDILNSNGKDGHVYYSFNKRMPVDALKLVNQFIKN
jgi:DNA-binding transcriptional ArsR family regulator